MITADCWQWHQLLGGQPLLLPVPECVTDLLVTHAAPSYHPPSPAAPPCREEQPQPVQADNSDQCLLEKMTTDI